MLFLSVVFFLLGSCLGLSPVTDCPNLLPDGTPCPADHDNVAYTYPDPEECSSYYECFNGCVNHMKCRLDYVYDSVHDTCTKQEDVCCECDGRPCADPSHCGHTGTSTTPNTDCGHIKDCTDVPDGYYPDEWNCRKYWICRGGKGEHHTCQDDAQGRHMMYDLVFNGCNYIQLTNCGERPNCDDCDEHCDTPPTPSPCPGNCVHHCCTEDSSPDGFYQEGPCENTYCRCVGGTGYLQNCPPTLVFNEPQIFCDFPFNVPGCQ